MRSMVKKVYISVISFTLVFLTIFATTYAWVGFYTHSSFDDFDMNLEVTDANMQYSLLISDNGIDFQENVPLINIQKQIMTNMGINYENDLVKLDDSKSINNYFLSKARLEPVSPSLNETTNILENFKAIRRGRKKPYFVESNNYFKFDIYLTVEPKEGIQSTTSINANVFLDEIENSLVGVICSGNQVNEEMFSSLPSSGEYSILNTIPKYFSINSANCARFALSVYNPIEFSQNYTNETPINTIIYQGGKKKPYLIENNIYDLGGILPEEYNFALRELNVINKYNLDINEVQTIRLNDLELTQENNTVWQKSSTLWDSDRPLFLGIDNGIRTKIKITVYFWFEGRDADCMRFIDYSIASLNLNFSTDRK